MDEERGTTDGAPRTAADLDPDVRPGVPREAPPEPVDRAPFLEPAQGPDRLTRAALDRPTPVYGTAQPPHGLSGRMRRWAYRIPEHRARHWMLLLAADRVDVAEDRLGGPLGRPLEALGLDAAAGRVRRDPISILAGVGAGILAATAVFAWAGGRRRPDAPPAPDES